MEENKLYPLTFCSLQDDYAWGTEEFKLADLGYRDSLIKEGWLAGNSIGEIMDTYIERVSGDETFEKYGRQFPLCVKNITVRGKMPLRVHPDDETASQRYDFLGKDKLWYILSAGKNARIYMGFKQSTDAGTLYSKCLDNTVGEILNVIAPHAGQCLHITPGTPHAAEGDLKIIEISESSPMDFCLCGWGETVSEEEFDPQLSLVEAMDFINYRRFTPASYSGLPDLPQLSVRLAQLDSALRFRDSDSGIVVTCVSGGVEMRMKVLNAEASYKIGVGDTMLIPAECKDFTLTGTQKGSEALISVTTSAENDRYINPDAAPSLEGEDDSDDTDDNITLI